MTKASWQEQAFKDAQFSIINVISNLFRFCDGAIIRIMKHISFLNLAYRLRKVILVKSTFVPPNLVPHWQLPRHGSYVVFHHRDTHWLSLTHWSLLLLTSFLLLKPTVHLFYPRPSKYQGRDGMRQGMEGGEVPFGGIDARSNYFLFSSCKSTRPPLLRPGFHKIYYFSFPEISMNAKGTFDCFN